MDTLAQVPFKPIEFLSRDVEVERRADGTVILQSRHRLKPHEKHVPAFVAKWATEAPDRVWLAQRRGPARDWLKVTYAEARKQIDSITQALLDRGFGPDKAVMILSSNSIEFALLTMAAMQARAPVAPVSRTIEVKHATIDLAAVLSHTGTFLRGDGTRYAAGTIQVSDLPSIGGTPALTLGTASLGGTYNSLVSLDQAVQAVLAGDDLHAELLAVGLDEMGDGDSVDGLLHGGWRGCRRGGLEVEPLPEVKLSGLFVANEKLAAALGQDLALMNQVGAVDDAERLADVVIGHDHADAARFQLENHLLYLCDGNRIVRGEGLVHQQKLGARHERAGDLQPAPFAAREGKGLLLRDVSEVQLVEVVTHPLGAFAAGHAGGLNDRENVLLDGKLAKNRRFLGQVTESKPAAKMNFSGAWFIHPCEDLK